MLYRALSISLAITAGVAGAVWLLSAENEGSFWGLQQDTTTSVPEAVSNQESAAQATPAGPVSETPSENALGFMLASVAEEYQQTIRYPDYSVPLTKAQAEAYQGNRYHPVVLPLEGDGRFVVTLDKFRFSQGLRPLCTALQRRNPAGPIATGNVSGQQVGRHSPESPWQRVSQSRHSGPPAT